MDLSSINWVLLVASLIVAPKSIVPRQICETRSPLLPKYRNSIA